MRKKFKNPAESLRLHLYLSRFREKNMLTKTFLFSSCRPRIEFGIEGGIRETAPNAHQKPVGQMAKNTEIVPKRQTWKTADLQWSALSNKWLETFNDPWRCALLGKEGLRNSEDSEQKELGRCAHWAGRSKDYGRRSCWSLEKVRRREEFREENGKGIRGKDLSEGNTDPIKRKIMISNWEGNTRKVSGELDGNGTKTAQSSSESLYRIVIRAHFQNQTVTNRQRYTDHSGDFFWYQLTFLDSK